MMAHVIIVRKWEKFHCDNLIFAKTKKYQIEKDKLCHTEINSKPGLNEQPNEGYNVFTISTKTSAIESLYNLYLIKVVLS